MADSKAYGFDKDAAQRIVNATRIVEEQFDDRFKTPDDYSIVYAKIVQSFGDGTYEAVQVIYDETTGIWEDASYGIDWAKDSAQTNPLVEASSSSSVAVDTVVIAILGGSTDGSVWTFTAPDGGTSDAPPHPFKVTFVGGDTWTIGADRGEAFRLVKDLIDIYDRDGSLLYTLQKTVAEPLICGANTYIYYKIDRTTAGVWGATPLFSAAWPPVAASTDQDSLYYPIAYTGTSGGVGQLQFSDITVYARPQQPSFAAFRSKTGAIVLDGVVRDGFGTTVTVVGAEIVVGNEAWVKVVSSPDVAPVVTPAIQTGVWPGWQTEVAGVLTRYYLIGYWSAADVWTPRHEGDLFLGTEYQLDIPAAAQAGNAQSYRVIASNDVASVGATKELFFDGHKLDVNVVGGDFESVDDDGELKLGGVTVDIDLNIITGASILGQTLTFTTTDRASETEKGLVQDLADAAGTPIAITIPTPTPSGTLVEGPGIDITEAPADTFTITSLLDDDGTGVVITDGVAGAAHVASLDYAVIWGHLKQGKGIDVTVVGDDATVTSLLSGSNSIDVTLGAVGAAHVVDTIQQMSIVTDANGLKLFADELAPGINRLYSIDKDGDKAWWRFVGHIAETSENSQTIEFISGTTADLWSADVTYQMSITADNFGLKLEGDEEDPADYSYYGTGSTSPGGREFQYLPDIMLEILLDTYSVEWTLTDSSLEADVIVQMSIEIDLNGLKLDGDVLAPGNRYFYGTDGAGDKGFQELESVTNIVGMRLHTGNLLQIQTQVQYIYDPASISAWTTVTGWTITSCSS